MGIGAPIDRGSVPALKPFLPGAFTRPREAIILMPLFATRNSAMSAIAAVIYGPDEDCDGLLAALGRSWRQAGLAVVGLVQVNGTSCAEDGDMELEVLHSGRRINICQDLGSCSTGACRLDPAGLAEAAGALRQALAAPADLVVVNKFGRMESEGGGLVAEIGEAVAAGLPLVIGVPARFLKAWDAFAAGLDQKLACDRAALERWRAGVTVSRPALAAP